QRRLRTLRQPAMHRHPARDTDELAREARVVRDQPVCRGGDPSQWMISVDPQPAGEISLRGGLQDGGDLIELAKNASVPRLWLGGDDFRFRAGLSQDLLRVGEVRQCIVWC